MLPGLCLVYHQSFADSDCGCRDWNCGKQVSCIAHLQVLSAHRGEKNKSGKQRREWQHPHLGCRGGRLHGAGAAAGNLCRCCAVADLGRVCAPKPNPEHPQPESGQTAGAAPSLLLAASLLLLLIPLLESWKGSWEALCLQLISRTGGAGILCVTKSCSKT